MRPEKLAAIEVLATLPEPDKDLTHKIECGLLHSRIPLCCVVFYIDGWHNLTPEEKDEYDRIYDAFWSGSFLPCPACLTKFLETGAYFSKVRGCDCECTCCECRLARDPSYVCPHGRHAEVAS
jgi:hypothetical protein